MRHHRPLRVPRLIRFRLVSPRQRTTNHGPRTTDHGQKIGLLVTVWAGISACALGEEGSAPPAIAVVAGTTAQSGSRTEGDAAAGRSGVPRLSSLGGLAFGMKGKRAVGSGGWGLGFVSIALTLAVCGGLVAAVRWVRPSAATGSVQVVGRVSLSPKHSVYLLRVGRRVLLVGAGPQGPPALISELDDLPEVPPGPQPGEHA